MTDYNDGKIHGWNGGVCPVHPKTTVEYWTRSNGRTEECGGALNWTHCERIYDIIAFKVTKKYEEPKEFWVNEYADGSRTTHNSEARARSYTPYSMPIRTAVRYREVTDE